MLLLSERLFQRQELQIYVKYGTCSAADCKMFRNIHHDLYKHRHSFSPLQFFVHFYRHLLIANNDILQVFFTTYKPYRPHQPESEPKFKAKIFLICVSSDTFIFQAELFDWVCMRYE